MNSSVEISNLSERLTSAQLKEIFSTVGVVVDIKFDKKRQRSAIVTFERSKDADEAIYCFHHGLIDNQKVYVRQIKQMKTVRERSKDRKYKTSKAHVKKSLRRIENTKKRRRSPSVYSYESYYSYYSYYSYSTEVDKKHKNRKPTTRKKR